MTGRERFQRMFEHREADRVPIIDAPWSATIERWRREGLPENVSWIDYFDVDCVAGIPADNSPRYPGKIVEQTEEYIVRTTKWGVTQRTWKHAASTPEFLDFTITSPDAWRKAKKRMTPDRDRVDWERLKKYYPEWRKKDLWIQANFWFGFDVAHSYAVGTERLLMAMIDNPEWVSEMFNHYLDVDLALFEMVWDAGYKFSAVHWPDDMGYKHSQFFSLDTYRELLKPVHKRAVEWAHAKGIKAHLHSCGDVSPLVPELLEIGVDALNPLEVKAGMDPVALKEKYGKELVLHGGINAVLWDDKDAIVAEIEKTLPKLKESGGYIFSSDHSVPSSVSLENFREIIATAKRVGTYS